MNLEQIEKEVTITNAKKEIYEHNKLNKKTL
jgi:hypothetical protein